MTQIAMQIPKKLRPLIEKPKRFKVAIGGRGSGKSTTFARDLIRRALVEKAKVACLREYQNSIEDSVHALLANEIRDLNVPGFEIQKASIECPGGGFRFRGLARGIEAIRSMFGFKYYWTEESQFLSEESINILTPTAREQESELWFSGNPMSSSDPFSKRFINPYLNDLKRDGYYEDDLHTIVFINYTDNPFFPDNLEQQRRWDQNNLDKALYEHIWEGAFNDSIEHSIISAEHFDACIDAHLHLPIQLRGARIVSHDPSDLGDDTKAVALRHGSVILEVKESRIGDVNEGADWALNFAIESQADLFVWDGDGMGIALRRQVDEYLQGKKIETQMYRGSTGVENPDELYQEPGSSRPDDPQKRTNKDTFRNRRAQYYWNLRDRVYSTYLARTKGEYIDPDKMISFSSSITDMDALRSEVCRIPRKPNPSGLIQIMTKEEMKRIYKLKSPNLADSVVMSLVTPSGPNDLTSKPKVQSYIHKNRSIRRMLK
jgi:phage terminase large subunit